MKFQNRYAVSQSIELAGAASTSAQASLTDPLRSATTLLPSYASPVTTSRATMAPKLLLTVTAHDATTTTTTTTTATSTFSRTIMRVSALSSHRLSTYTIEHSTISTVPSTVLLPTTPSYAITSFCTFVFPGLVKLSF